MSGEGSREEAGPFKAACIPRNTPAPHFPSSPAELQGPSALLRPGVELKPEACRGLCEGEGEQTHPCMQSVLNKCLCLPLNATDNSDLQFRPFRQPLDGITH